MTTPTPNELDQATIWLIFALRDSLTNDGPSHLDFWDGRVTTAIDTAAAGSDCAAQAITTASRKLQIDVLSSSASKTVQDIQKIIDEDYGAWSQHVSRNLVYIVALARVQNQELRAARKEKGE